MFSVFELCVCLEVGKKVCQGHECVQKQRTTCGTLFCPPSRQVDARDQTPVSRLGSKCLYPQSHLTNPEFLVCLFLRMGEGTGKQDGEMRAVASCPQLWDLG